MPKAMIQHSRPTIGPKDRAAVRRVLDSGHLTPGPETEAFEGELAKCAGVKHAVALSSGHSALHSALLALGVGPGSNVIIPTYACTALLNAIGYTRAKPVVADVDPETFNITPETAAHRMTGKTRAIIAVHAFGLPCDVSGIKKLGVPVPLATSIIDLASLVLGQDLRAQGRNTVALGLGGDLLRDEIVETLSGRLG